MMKKILTILVYSFFITNNCLAPPPWWWTKMQQNAAKKEEAERKKQEAERRKREKKEAAAEAAIEKEYDKKKKDLAKQGIHVGLEGLDHVVTTTTQSADSSDLMDCWDDADIGAKIVRVFIIKSRIRIGSPMDIDIVEDVTQLKIDDMRIDDGYVVISFDDAYRIVRALEAFRLGDLRGIFELFDMFFFSNVIPVDYFLKAYHIGLLNGGGYPPSLDIVAFVDYYASDSRICFERVMTQETFIARKKIQDEFFARWLRWRGKMCVYI